MFVKKLIWKVWYTWYNDNHHHNSPNKKCTNNFVSGTNNIVSGTKHEIRGGYRSVSTQNVYLKVLLMPFYLSVLIIIVYYSIKYVFNCNGKTRVVLYYCHGTHSPSTQHLWWGWQYNILTHIMVQISALSATNCWQTSSSMEQIILLVNVGFNECYKLWKWPLFDITIFYAVGSYQHDDLLINSCMDVSKYKVVSFHV
jgi:hypothetical protein